MVNIKNATANAEFAMITPYILFNCLTIEFLFLIHCFNIVLSGHLAWFFCASLAIPKLTNKPIAKGNSFCCAIVAKPNIVFLTSIIVLSTGSNSISSCLSIILLISSTIFCFCSLDNSFILINASGGSCCLIT